MSEGQLPTPPESKLVAPNLLADRFRYLHSPAFAEVLRGLRATLLVTTYQAGKLIAVRATGDGLSMLLRSFDQAMGLAVSRNRIAIGTRFQIWTLANAPDIARQIEPAGRHDACYLPRSSHVTGDISVHELAWGGEGLWAVNTRFSCLCTLSDDYSFVPRWQPPFVSRVAAEDRCHLNGLAMEGGRPRYATALGETDSTDGWRADKATGGVLIDVAANRIVARGLSMPHSPRMHDGRLWLLDSGTGGIVAVDPTSGHVERVAEVPGYCRGLALAGRLAFVGLSKFRETSTFGGLPIAHRVQNPKCGVWVVDLLTGQTIATLEFEAGVEEIFDVQLLPGTTFPAIIGLEKETIRDTFVLPAASIEHGQPKE
jgi:uncharacterized protein (TIGR03032 family)